MKGIVLAGGSGSRLYPITGAMSKQLVPVYDKPMVYYPLSTLMLAGIRDILLISTPRDLPLYRQALGDGGDFGLRLSYAEQSRPEGLAQALLIAESFISGQPICLILGDNLFYGHGLTDIVQAAAQLQSGALIFAYYVRDPRPYGVVEFDDGGSVVSLEEKPDKPKSNYVVPGMYFYDGRAAELAHRLKPSARGELEITDLNLLYHRQGELKVSVMGRGIAWLDAGTAWSLLESATFVAAIQERQGLQVACLEEIALRNGWLAGKDLHARLKAMGQSDYCDYLRGLARQYTEAGG